MSGKKNSLISCLRRLGPNSPWLNSSNTPLVIHTCELFGSSLSCCLLPYGPHHQKGDMETIMQQNNTLKFFELCFSSCKKDIFDDLQRTLSLYSEDSTTHHMTGYGLEICDGKKSCILTIQQANGQTQWRRNHSVHFSRYLLPRSMHLYDLYCPKLPKTWQYRSTLFIVVFLSVFVIETEGILF